MTLQAAIEVKELGKLFRLRSSRGRSLKAAALDLLRRGSGSQDFWALRGIDFTVRKGETLGIIGANGAGKSTLLALLAGTKTPSEGSVVTRGTLSSLLELGAGFHPDLTGGENVFLAGAIMGLTRRQMQERFASIVEFSGIGHFIDHPVKHYSSGMYVRLGFAVAVEVNPDILLIDEVLAVGDVDFQRKCLRKMQTFRENGKTMLIISHDLSTIQSISDRILLLDEGRLMGIGDPGRVVSQYELQSRSEATRAVGREWGTGEVRIVKVRFLSDDGREVDSFETGEKLHAEISYEAGQRVPEPVFGFAIADEAGAKVHGSNTEIEHFHVPAVGGKGAMILTIDSLALGSGNYFFSFSVHSKDHRTNYHRLDNRFCIAVKNEKGTEGCAVLPSRWKMGG